MNEEYPYEEELKLSTDRDLFDEYRFRSGEEDSLYEALSGELRLQRLTHDKRKND